jgi:hypothetical protein
MSKHKHHRDHQDADRPQSTDVADLERDTSADAASAHQRRENHDERFSADGESKQDVHGRIISVAVEGDMTKITIGLGKNQGVQVGMEGYIPKGGGMLADFQIEEAHERTAIARVELTPDAIHGHTGVIVNPTSKPKSAEPQVNVETRVIGVRIEGGRTKILLGRGQSHGARVGQKGTLFAGSREIADFEVDTAHPTYCEAFVDATPDMVHQASKVVLNRQ